MRTKVRVSTDVLDARDVFNHGVAADIGTGIFVPTGVVAANMVGPGILLSFVLAGLACACVSFAYAELSSMIPVSGSAYTYAYATFGELFAIIGWDLLLEYAVGASAGAASGWSAYMQTILKGLGLDLPRLSHCGTAKLADDLGLRGSGACGGRASLCLVAPLVVAVPKTAKVR